MIVPGASHYGLMGASAGDIASMVPAKLCEIDGVMFLRPFIIAACTSQHNTGPQLHATAGRVNRALNWGSVASVSSRFCGPMGSCVTSFGT